MTTFRNLLLAICLPVLFTACGGGSRESQEQTASNVQAFNEIADPEGATAAILDQYEQLKTALVESDAAKAKETAATFAGNINKIRHANLPETYFEALVAIQKNAAAIADSEDIEEQRSLFVPLTDNIYSVVKEFPSALPVYYAYCPMAFDDNGGYWLTKEKEILNPYFGEKMLRCGVIQETIGGQ